MPRNSSELRWRNHTSCIRPRSHLVILTSRVKSIRPHSHLHTALLHSFTSHIRYFSIKLFPRGLLHPAGYTQYFSRQFSLPVFLSLSFPSALPLRRW